MKQKISSDINEIKAQLDEIIHAPYSYHVGVSISSRKRHERDSAIFIKKGDELVCAIGDYTWTEVPGGSNQCSVDKVLLGIATN